MIIYRGVLHLISIIWSMVLYSRHLLYQIGIFESYSPKVLTIGVGNLSLGGSSKTPMTIALAEMMSHSHTVAIVSRGYGRSTRALIVADSHSSPDTIGDEPFMIQMLLPHITLIVCAQRARAIRYIESNMPQISCIILDDSLQHRAITPHIQLLLTPYHRPFVYDHLIPVGRLRDLVSRASAADAIVVTQCPSAIDTVYSDKLSESLSRFYLPIFWVRYIYHDPIDIFSLEPCSIPDRVVSISAIADVTSWLEFLNQKTKVIKHFKYRDHYVFDAHDVSQWISIAIATQTTAIVCTQKDATKLYSRHQLIASSGIKVIAIPISIEWVNRSEWDKWLGSKISKYI